MERARIPVAVAPGEAAWAVDAIRRGGGEPVGLGGKPSGLVWTDPEAAQELGDVLRAHPGISWVQLPTAGIERVAEAGVLDRRRQWTSAKGAYAEPVAEHALALLLAGLRYLPERARARSWDQRAWLVNVARGALVDTAALVGALRSDQIGGAALDVTDPEPLPAGHPLWDLPNCLITPHTADTEQMTEPLLAARIAENVRRFAAGHELEGQVDPDLGY